MNFIFYLIIVVVVLLGLLALYFRNRIGGKKNETKLTNLPRDVQESIENYGKKQESLRRPGGYAQDIYETQGREKYSKFLNTKL